MEKRVVDAEKQVGELETALAEVEARIAAGDTSEETLALYAETQKNLENAMSVWELAQTELDEYVGSCN